MKGKSMGQVLLLLKQKPQRSNDTDNQGLWGPSRQSCTRRGAWNSRPGTRGEQKLQAGVSECLSVPVLRLK